MRKNKNVLFTLLVFALLLNSVLITFPVQATRQSKALNPIAVIAVIGAAIVGLELGYIGLRRRKPPASTEKDTITRSSEKKVDGSWENNRKRN